MTVKKSNSRLKQKAQKWLDPHFLNEAEGYACSEEEIYVAGYAQAIRDAVAIADRDQYKNTAGLGHRIIDPMAYSIRETIRKLAPKEEEK